MDTMNPPGTDHNCRLLVVDDNRSIHEDFQKILLRSTGASSEIEAAEAELFGDSPSSPADAQATFCLDSAFQGKEALDLVKRAREQGKPYAMAFMDVRMPPGWDGIETTAKIWEVDPDLQIVICTAYSDYSWDEMLKKLGQSDRLVILKKPFDNVEVLQLASNLVQKWQVLHDSKGRVTELEKKVAESEAQAVRAQKLEAMAEEIQTPVQTIAENLKLILQRFGHLNSTPAASGAADEKTDISELLKDVPAALQQSLEGIERVSKAVEAAKGK